jgi:hypothetical protein
MKGGMENSTTSPSPDATSTATEIETRDDLPFDFIDDQPASIPSPTPSTTHRSIMDPSHHDTNIDFPLDPTMSGDTSDDTNTDVFESSSSSKDIEVSFNLKENSFMDIEHSVGSEGLLGALKDDDVDNVNQNGMLPALPTTAYESTLDNPIDVMWTPPTLETPAFIANPLAYMPPGHLMGENIGNNEINPCDVILASSGILPSTHEGKFISKSFFYMRLYRTSDIHAHDFR